MGPTPGGANDCQCQLWLNVTINHYTEIKLMSRAITRMVYVEIAEGRRWCQNSMQALFPPHDFQMIFKHHRLRILRISWNFNILFSSWASVTQGLLISAKVILELAAFHVEKLSLADTHSSFIQRPIGYWRWNTKPLNSNCLEQGDCPHGFFSFPQLVMSQIESNRGYR